MGMIIQVYIQIFEFEVRVNISLTRDCLGSSILNSECDIPNGFAYYYAVFCRWCQS